ncbi:MAG: LptF/LptG family permease [Myxococcota bacterium]
MNPSAPSEPADAPARAGRRDRRPRQSPKLTRYIVSEMVLPSVFALVAFGLVVLMTDLLGYAELIVNRGLGPGEVGQIAGLQLIPTLARTLPFAVLVGSLVGLGRLSADRELLALETSGFSARQLARPGLLFALVATVASVALTVVISPASQRAVRDHMISLSEEKPGLALREGAATSIGGWRIEAREVEDEGARLAGILLFMPSLGETLFSQRGAVRTDPDGRKRLVLEDGLVLSNGENRASLLRFDQMDTVLPEIEDEADVPVDPVATLAFGPLLEEASRTDDPAAARWARIEAHRRIALGAAALPFGLLAMGLALGRRDLSRSGGTVMGLIGAIAYYALFQLAEGLLRNEDAPVGLVVWIPNAVLIVVATVLLFRAGRHASESDRSKGSGSGSVLARAGLVRDKLRMKRAALPRYVSGQFVRMVAASIVGLVFAYLVIDVFDNLKWFNQYGSTADEIARYYGARLPVLVGRVIPMALLIAVALTISLLGANGELLGMRACGIPVFRVLAPVWLLCGLAVPAYHLLANEVVPRATAEASLIKKRDIKNQDVGPVQQRERVWYRVGPRIYEMERLDLFTGRASDVTLYDLGQDGLPVRRTDAERARSISSQGLWILDDARTVELADGDHLRRPTSVPRLAEFGEETPSEIETAHMTPSDLRVALADPDLEPREISAYQTDLQMKIAAPLACLLLPLIALFFAATGPPFPRPVHTLIACAIIAVSHALATSFSGSMGYGGNLDPVLAGWGPSVLFGAVAAGMGFRLRRKLSRSG